MKRTGTAALAVGLTALAVGLAGCGAATGTQLAASGKLTVVATTTQVADFARQVGGSRVQVTQILKPNVDPHDYDPSPADIATIGKAKLVVKNGVDLEKWLDQTISSAGFSGTVVDTSAGVSVRKGNGTDEEKVGDPHIWHSPLNAIIMSTDIEKAFAKADPAGASAYQANLTAYVAKLRALDTDIAKKIDTLPADDRKLVTNHDAFGYYIDRYHLQFVGSVIPSFDTSAELSGKDIQNLVAQIKATHTKAIFSESSLPPKTAATIAQEAGVKVEAGEDSLYGDTLGPAGSAGATYLQMEEHNTDVIVNALK
ncbi:metal ABC transporter substrate-binding protein [Fodinicola feengrottensis]|uniref:Metal ABC transporter substrate-binding protein n=1 Tax=Fodinicola feengrottensis TaxID=435914 RepID=A0ABN2JCW0_9ACTN|nr:metal ABC transporter substrate-binding protein [Fodinicola feengrottensis]